MSLSNFRLSCFPSCVHPRSALRLGVASQVIQQARQGLFRFSGSGLEAVFHRGFDPVLRLRVAQRLYKRE
jgi:hypothetical protein